MAVRDPSSASLAFEQSRDYVQSLARGLAVLTVFDSGHPTLSLADVAARAGVSRAAARRLLLTLQHLGYVRALGREYALSPRVLELGFGALGSLKLTDLAQPLLAYIGFFRPAKQQLGWGRALRLMREVAALAAAPVLITGLVEAARTLDEKRHAPGWKPLGNHNYLRRCLESAEARHASAGVVAAAPASPAPMPRSKAGAGLVALEGMKR